MCLPCVAVAGGTTPGKCTRKRNSSFHFGQRLFQTTRVRLVTRLRTLSLQQEIQVKSGSSPGATDCAMYSMRGL